jgi:hypothetical protein
MSAALLSIPAGKIAQFTTWLDTGDASQLAPMTRETGEQFDTAVLSDLQARAIREFEDGDVSRVDAWLAPRLHYCLRLSKQSASQSGIWSWLAAEPMRKFMDVRWSRDTHDNWKWRYTARDLLRNGIARLWWGAELTRSGADYTLVCDAFRTVRTFMFISELRYSWHREAARAFTMVARDENLNDNAIKDLSKTFNVYLKTRALEIWDASESVGDAEQIDKAWLSKSPSFAVAAGPLNMLVGPTGGVSRRKIEESLCNTLRKMVARIPQ